MNQRFLLKSDSFIAAAILEIQFATIGDVQPVSSAQKAPAEERRLFRSVRSKAEPPLTSHFIDGRDMTRPFFWIRGQTR
jgi:hypothetical protein